MATGVFYMTMFIGAAIGVAVTGFLLSDISFTHLNSLLNLQPLPLDSIPSPLLTRIVRGLYPVSALSTYIDSETLTKFTVLAHQTFFYAFRFIMYLCTLLTGIGVILSFFTQSKKL